MQMRCFDLLHNVTWRMKSCSSLYSIDCHTYKASLRLRTEIFVLKRKMHRSSVDEKQNTKRTQDNNRLLCHFSFLPHFDIIDIIVIIVNRHTATWNPCESILGPIRSIDCFDNVLMYSICFYNNRKPNR